MTDFRPGQLWGFNLDGRPMDLQSTFDLVLDVDDRFLTIFEVGCNDREHACVIMMPKKYFIDSTYYKLLEDPKP